MADDIKALVLLTEIAAVWVRTHMVHQLEMEIGRPPAQKVPQ